MTLNELFENYDFEKLHVCDLLCYIIYADGTKDVDGILLSKAIKRFGNKKVISWNITPWMDTKISIELN